MLSCTYAHANPFTHRYTNTPLLHAPPSPRPGLTLHFLHQPPPGPEDRHVASAHAAEPRVNMPVAIHGGGCLSGLLDVLPARKAVDLRPIRARSASVQPPAGWLGLLSPLAAERGLGLAPQRIGSWPCRSRRALGENSRQAQAQTWTRVPRRETVGDLSRQPDQGGRSEGPRLEVGGGMGSEEPVGRQSGEKGWPEGPPPQSPNLTDALDQLDQLRVCGANGDYRADVASFKLTLKSGDGLAAIICVPAFFLCRGPHRSQ